MAKMTVSDRGAAAIMAEEAIVPGPYLDSVGVWTIYVGHTAAAGAPIPKDMPRGVPANIDGAIREALVVFKRDLQKYADDVSAAVKVPLAQHEFDALTSFHYNTGAIARATLTKTLNAGNKPLAGQQFMNWVANSELRKRREHERDLFLHGKYSSKKITVWRVATSGEVIWKPVKIFSQAEVLDMMAALDQPELVTPEAAERQRLKDVQTILKNLGLYGGNIDGLWGPKSQGALDAFFAADKRITELWSQ